MHLVYQNAIATIVAVDPDPECSANSGLFGVSKPRTLQLNVALKDRTLVLTQPHISYPLLKSKWASRGWTYQEGRLSRRCVYFTESGLYYACHALVRSESIVQYLPIGPKGGDSLVGPIKRIQLPLGL